MIGDESEARFQTHSQFYCAKVRLKSMFLQAMVASESVFDHANRISCLKLGVLVYTVSRLSKCRGYQNVKARFNTRLSAEFFKDSLCSPSSKIGTQRSLELWKVKAVRQTFTIAETHFSTQQLAMQVTFTRLHSSIITTVLQ